MNKIAFTAGYGDPTRTIRQKYGDYGKIEELRSKLTAENSKLTEQLELLETQRTSLIQKFQNVVGVNKAEIEEKLKQLEEQISSIKNKIEENRSTIVNSWYGFHERL